MYFTTGFQRKKDYSSRCYEKTSPGSWCGVVWYDMVWFGKVWYGML